MQDSTSFGEWLRHRRRAMDMTQSQLAAQVGYAERTIRKLEADELRPSKQMAEILAKYFGISLQEFEPFVRFARGTPLRQVAQDFKVDRTDHSPWRVVSPSSSSLPLQLTSFVGRERESATVAQLLGSTRLLTLTGVGGVGKTRLALHVAGMMVGQFADGVWLVELAPLADPALLPQAMCTSLRLSNAEGPPLTALVDYLRPKRLLLIVDNCEHMVEACAELADTLLRACPDLCLLAISREPLAISGETSWIVPPLSLRDPAGSATNATLPQSEAEYLFVERARSISPTFSLTRQNSSVIARICQRLDGIPLAIELAAARVKGLELEQIAARLDDSFRLLTVGTRTTVPRQRTLEATIDWSYALLTESERVLLRRLSVFAGGWTLEGAENVCGIRGLAQEEILYLLMHLVDKSLVVAESVGSEKRYRLLETIRQYSANKRVESGEIEAVRYSHLDYFCKLAEEAEPKLRGAEQIVWLDRLEQERDNLRAAWDWAIERDPEMALQLTYALMEFWMRRGYTNEAREKLGRLDTRTGDWGMSIKRARVLLLAGRVAIRDWDYSTAMKYMEASLTIARAIGSKRDVAIALRGVGIAARGLGSNQLAHTCLEESLGLLLELGEDWYAANVLMALALLACNEGDYLVAQKWSEEAIALFRRVGDLPSIVYPLNVMGMGFMLQGDYERAAIVYEEALDIAREYKNEYQNVVVACGSGLVSLRLGDVKQARALFEADFDQVRHQGKGHVNVWLICLAGVLSAEGKSEAAARVMGAGELGIDAARFQVELAHRREFAHIRSVIRAQLDEASFAKALAEGRSLTLEQAIALAVKG